MYVCPMHCFKHSKFHLVQITDRCGGKNHLLEQLCYKLQVGSATQLAGAVESLLMVNTAVPSLEDFVEQVCDVVLVAGREFLPRPTESPCEVPRILEGWLDVLSAVTRSQSIS
ncbi:uncharacterized protein LOC112346137 [Selaginella moellendorffii]|uniref:uncharacterized protein LOC112346137 n=1 Tax=Selaginella moellendorffii TaxID=88036 RepID=UPI000D1C5515|nr:uncharacterized protein LOC112346137 [Selaginella moellendorffii]|eukprot:XP_024530125.1 uncharacterized protein LOC112346137 [Selaginella moellendorffii]